ncbi:MULTISPECIES: helix-turn-helix domain-containing protein [Asticcacaulis]|jgi:hypothetical protein|uniref:helix-turn-helix domain-containing protein n=1 Tax=Asticcacaulis TaxID=76890 RepID=UPI001AE4CC6F|nr:MULTISPECIES: helix-turn-helix domain-containing protein [Asticcacaulis]MBP2160559.1 hypothetical protein [Asticcacaulis solisilvae]MDR6801604.1 hypothetical protein [Asticcacaulis sp. BE141]
MNGKTGHRSVTPNSLKGELLAKGFKGLPEGMTYNQALKLVRRYINGCNELSLRAKFLMQAFLQLQAKAIVEVDGQFDLVNDMTQFTVFAKNTTLQDMLDMSRRTVQKALAELREKLFVWCNDSPSRNRSRGHGICLLPTFARLAELNAAAADRQGRIETVRFMQSQFTSTRIELEGMKRLSLFTHHPLIDDLIKVCDVMRRSTNTEKGLERLLFLKQSVDELKALVVLDIEMGKQESPQGDQSDTPITYKLNKIHKDVEAWQEVESGSACVPDPEAGVNSNSEGVTVLGPEAEKIVPVVEAAFRARSLITYEDQGLPPKRRLRLYGNSAAGLIKLHRSAVSELKVRYGEVGASYILIQAAFDPEVRNRAGWARSFLRANLQGTVVDTRGSFHRWKTSVESDALLQ